MTTDHLLIDKSSLSSEVLCYARYHSALFLRKFIFKKNLNRSSFSFRSVSTNKSFEELLELEHLNGFL